jgi:Haem-binding domain
MKKTLKIAAIVLAVAFVIAQFFRPNRTDPPIVEADTLEASMSVPDNVKAVLARSCNDCHSNKTVYPWYSNVSPVSWFLVNHIQDGRRHLNFSVWNTYEKKRKVKKLEEIGEQLDLGEMPLSSYLWLHRDAVLTREEAQALKDWAGAARQEVDASGAK